MNRSIWDTIKLNNGTVMPQFGLGCFNALGDEIYRAVQAAVNVGYRLFDTATRYENEADVGRALRESGIPREELFVVSKIWPTEFPDPVKGVEYSLHELDMEYLDLYLLHWPGQDVTLRLKAWETLLNYREKGLLRAVGVSNFTVPHLQQLIQEFGEVPVVDQIELHPWYQQKEISAYCAKQGIVAEPWGPICRGRVFEEPLFAAIGEKYRKNPVQIALRWHLQHDHIIIPKSAKPQRIEENSQLFDFSLTSEEMARIDALENGFHIGDDPNTYTGEDFPAPFSCGTN